MSVQVVARRIAFLEEKARQLKLAAESDHNRARARDELETAAAVEWAVEIIKKEYGL